MKPWNSLGEHMVQDSEFVRWSSAFHHVFVFTVTCVHLYHRVCLLDRNFLVQKYIYIYTLLPVRNYMAQSGLAIKIEIYIG